MTTPEQIAQLITDRREVALKMALRMVRNIEDAEDVVQNACIKAIRGCANFRGDSALESWFISIVRREALMLLRAKRGTVAKVVSHSAVEDYPAYFIDNLMPDHETPEKIVIRAQKFIILRSFIVELNSINRSALDNAIQEAAGTGNQRGYKKGLSSTEKARLFRARKYLKERIYDEGLEELKIA
jgi:RNA polymerase sigma-70 factor, ECF subfamily